METDIQEMRDEMETECFPVPKCVCFLSPSPSPPASPTPFLSMESKKIYIYGRKKMR